MQRERAFAHEVEVIREPRRTTRDVLNESVDLRGGILGSNLQRPNEMRNASVELRQGCRPVGIAGLLRDTEDVVDPRNDIFVVLERIEELRGWL